MHLFYCSGEWHVFSGNELGALIGWWMLHSYRSKHPKADLSKVYMLASTVSSKLLRSMARKEGFNFEVNLFEPVFLFFQTKTVLAWSLLEDA